MMDTTENYIKMCEGSKKYIDKKEELWDWCYDKESKIVEVIGSLNPGHSMGDNYHRDEIPLYRQDQLQEMISDKMENWKLIDALRSYIHYQAPIVDKEIRYYSMEQLWLTFVMKEKYDKAWDDVKEEWT